jgi:heme A synthase
LTDFIILVHTYVPYPILAVSVIAGIWGFVLYFMKRETASRAWYYSLYLTVGLAAVQAILGIALVALGLKPGKPNDSLYYLHYVYGAIVALGIPIGISYATGGKNPRRDLLIFSLVALIVAAAAGRALMTGPHL